MTCTLETVATCDLGELAESFGLVVNSLTLLVAVFALAVAIYTFFLTRRHLNVERVHRLTERMYELDGVLLGALDVQKLLYQRANDTSDYFVGRDGQVPDELHFKVKSYIYMCLTCFDEVISIAKDDKYLKTILEYDNSISYISREMRHPLFRELRRKTEKIWGRQLNSFVDLNCSDEHQEYSAAELQVL